MLSHAIAVPTEGLLSLLKVLNIALPELGARLIAEGELSPATVDTATSMFDCLADRLTAAFGSEAWTEED